MKISFYHLSFLFLINLTFISIFFPSCKKEDNKTNINQYENCCGTAPLQGELDTGIFFIPNIITPNGDGFNDILQVYNNAGIEIINFIKISNQEGETILEKTNIPAQNTEVIWNAIDNQGNKYEGLFEYEIQLTSINGFSKSFMGKICSYSCEAGCEINEFPNQNLTNCAFPSQHNGDATWNSNMPSNESSDCF